MSDPIADFLTRVRNATDAHHRTVEIPASNLKTSLTDILKEEGFVKNYEIIQNEYNGILKIYLKYGANDEKVITGLKRISKPGLRVYVKADEVPKVLNGLGIALISTSEGVLTDKQARAKRLGGEVLAYVW
jgi:small subunit ribosomal protein S8